MFSPLSPGFRGPWRFSYVSFTARRAKALPSCCSTGPKPQLGVSEAEKSPLRVVFAEFDPTVTFSWPLAQTEVIKLAAAFGF